MAVEVCAGDVRVRRLLARDRVGNLTVTGALSAEPDGFKVYLDDARRPAGVLARGWCVKLHVRSPRVLSRLLPVLPRKRALLFAGISARARHALAEHWTIVMEHTCWLYYLKGRPIGRATHRVRPLEPRHARLVARHWSHGGPDAAEYLRGRIKDGPACAVFEKGRPVSWALMQDDGQLGVMFTLPRARGRGYAKSVALGLSRAVRARGRTPFLYTLQSNKPAQRLAEKIGFHRWGDYRWLEARSR